MSYPFETVNNSIILLFNFLPFSQVISVSSICSIFKLKFPGHPLLPCFHNSVWPSKQMLTYRIKISSISVPHIMMLLQKNTIVRLFLEMFLTGHFHCFSHCLCLLRYYFLFPSLLCFLPLPFLSNSGGRSILLNQKEIEIIQTYVMGSAVLTHVRNPAGFQLWL